VAEKIVSDDMPIEDSTEYTQYLDPKYAEQLMAEGILDEEPAQEETPKKNATSETFPEAAPAGTGQLS
jgi:hypothetical protein